MILLIIIKTIFFLGLIFMVGIFAGGETALTSLRWSAGKKIIKEKGVESLRLWFRDPDRYLTFMLLGNAALVVVASVVSVSVSIDIAVYFGLNEELVTSGSMPLVILLVLVFGEVTPKSLAKMDPERFSVRVIDLLVRLEELVSPAVAFFMYLSRPATRLFPAVKRTLAYDHVSEEDIRSIVHVSTLEGTLNAEEEKMIRRILKFGESEVHEVMIPRVHIRAVDIGDEPDKIFKKITEWGLSRVPAYKDSLDNVVGVIYAKDILNALQNKDLIIPEDLLRPACFVPETKMLDDLLREFQRSGVHLAIVVDEYGGTAGLVTIEDLVEEITGEIWDEYDVKERTIKILGDGRYIIKAKEDIDKVNEELKLALPADEFDTMGGFVIDLFGRVPKENESINYNNLTITVLDADRRKVNKLLITRLTSKNLKKGKG